MFGYTYRRVFSFGLATPSGANDGAAFDSQALNNWRYKDFQNAGNGNRSDVTQVACVIKTFAQTDSYRISSANAYNANGLCFKNANSQQVPWGNYSSFSRCKINFAGNNFPTKRSEDGGEERKVVGEFGGWDIESIEMLDEEPVVWLPEDYEISNETAIPLR